MDAASPHNIALMQRMTSKAQLAYPLQDGSVESSEWSTGEFSKVMGDILTEKDIKFDIGAETAIDIYYHASGGKLRPAIITVHGMGGDKSQQEDLAREFASWGYVAAPANYGKAGDINTAVEWLRENAAAYGVDPDHIGLWGFSRGGDASTKTTLTATGKAAVQAAVIVSGGTPQNAELAHAGAPPMLLFAAEDDRNVPCEGSKKLLANLKKAGCDGELVLYPDGGHNPHKKRLDTFYPKVRAFYERTLGKAPVPAALLADGRTFDEAETVV